MRDKKGRFMKGNKPKVHFQKGCIPWNKGKKIKGHKQSQETREKIRKANLGKKYSYETRKRLSMAINKDAEFTGFKRPIRLRIRAMGKYLDWRSKVFKRDNYHCQKCGEKGYLNAHHIIPFSEIIKIFNIKTIDDANKCEDLWDIGNGITYCKECHIGLEILNRNKVRIASG